MSKFLLALCFILPACMPDADTTTMQEAARSAVSHPADFPAALSPLHGGATTEDSSWCDHDSETGVGWCCNQSGTVTCCCDFLGFCECEIKPIVLEP